MWCEYGPPMWGFWVIFPIMGFAFMVVMMFMMARMLRGRVGMCAFGQHDEAEDLRREVRDLKNEIETLKRAK